MFRRSYFGQGTGPIFFQSLACRGTEVSILQCPRSFSSYSYCSHSRDAGVRCEGIIITVNAQGCIAISFTHEQRSAPMVLYVSLVD